MKTSTKILISLAVLALVDTVIPVPITALVLVYVVLEKPVWFSDLVAGLYENRNRE